MAAELAGSSMSGIVEIGEQQNGHQVELTVPQILRITLSEVRTSGFRWVMRPFDQHIIALVADEFDPGVSGPGGGATHRWEFRAEAIGTVEIGFEYRRPWERALPVARSFSVSVRVT
jgi:predicted secreted protein